jgi:nicotinamidase-related amidase
MKSANNPQPALILIDVQKAFEDVDYWGGSRNNPFAETNIGELLSYWRQNQLPVFHVKHCSVTPTSPLVEGKPGNDFMDVAQPVNDEPIISKNVNSAFIGTNLQQLLTDLGTTTVVIAGFTTDHCVSTTTRMAANLGFETILVHDASVSFAKEGINGEPYSADTIHAVSLASLKDEFATLLTTEGTKGFVSQVLKERV